MMNNNNEWHDNDNFPSNSVMVFAIAINQSSAWRWATNLSND